MTQQELREHHQKANTKELSEFYFRCEGSGERRKHFEDLWFAIGFQARNSSFTLEQVFRLMGQPDLATGNPSSGMVGWLMQSVDSVGEQDVIVGFDIEAGVVCCFWSNSVVPECSPAQHMTRFGVSEMKRKTVSNTH